MKLMRPGTVVVITIAVLVAIVPVARADVSAVVIHGKIKDHERAIVADAVKQAVLDSSWSVSETTFAPSEVDGIVVCLDLDRPWPCVEPTASAKGVQRLVVVHVEHKGKAVLVTGQVILQSEAVPVIEQRHCEPCSEANLDLSARDMTKVLLRRTSASQGTTAIELHTVPPGASIAIDGKLVGASDARLPISAGLHQVQLQRSGYRTESRSITVAQGQTYKLAVTLTPDDGGGGARFPLVPALIAGAGAIALVGGTIYSFTVDSPSSFEQPRYLYSGPAIGLAAAGGAAVGVGIYLWLRAPRETASRSAPTASLRPGGGVFGWTTSF